VDDPLHVIGTAALGTILLMALFACVALARLMKWVGPEAPRVVKLEMQWSSDRAGAIVSAWRKLGVEKSAKHATYVDFAFLIAYGCAIAAAGSLLAGRWSHNESEGAIITCVGLFAPLLDAFENVGMLLMIKGHVDQPWPLATSVVALAKWVLIVVAGGLLLWSLFF
jgi:hypothetical protein